VGRKTGGPTKGGGVHHQRGNMAVKKSGTRGRHLVSRSCGGLRRKNGRGAHTAFGKFGNEQTPVYNGTSTRGQPTDDAKNGEKREYGERMGKPHQKKGVTLSYAEKREEEADGYSGGKRRVQPKEERHQFKGLS